MEKLKSYGERSRGLAGQFIEHLSSVRELTIDEKSRELLRAIAEEQNKPEGKRYIFAPNHIHPKSALRKELALADDFPVLNKVLVDAGIVKNYPVARGDWDLPVDGLISRFIYETHRKIFSGLATRAVGMVPLSTNRFDRKLAAKKNIPSIRRIRDILEQKIGNITFYPFGKWYPSGEQDFSDTIALPGGRLSKEAKSKGEEGFNEWEHRLKRGIFAMSRITGAPIVPIHVAREGDDWSIRVGEPIETSRGDTKEAIEEEMARLYLQQMQRMDAEARRDTSSH